MMEILKPDGPVGGGGMGDATGILGRLAERVLGWVALALVILLGIAIYQMPSETKAAIWSAIWRSAAWLMIVGVIPWFARLFVSRILEISSNWAGVLLLAGLFAVDVIAAVLLMTGWPSGGWAWFGAFVALALAVVERSLG